MVKNPFLAPVHKGMHEAQRADVTNSQTVLGAAPVAPQAIKFFVKLTSLESHISMSLERVL